MVHQLELSCRKNPKIGFYILTGDNISGNFEDSFLLEVRNNARNAIHACNKENPDHMCPSECFMAKLALAASPGQIQIILKALLSR